MGNIEICSLIGTEITSEGSTFHDTSAIMTQPLSNTMTILPRSSMQANDVKSAFRTRSVGDMLETEIDH